MAAGLMMLGATAQATPIQAPLIGEIMELTLNNPNDPFSGGTMVVRGERIILPRNLLIDFPANRLALPDLFKQAPAGCTANESGLARLDACLHGNPGAIATVSANRTNGGNLIAGDVSLAKGTEFIVGQVTFIDFTNGFIRVNGTAGSATEGMMVRFNDPPAHHTLQQGPGCGSGGNCSADKRFNADPDNYTIVFINGYPACIPSTLSGGARTRGAAADGTGDPFCPSTNRGSLTVADSTRFAPIQVGDPITLTGNREIINGTEFLSAWQAVVQTPLLTRNDPTQPDYVYLNNSRWMAPGFPENKVTMDMEGAGTLSPPDADIFSLHHEPVFNKAQEVPLGSTVNTPRVWLANGVGWVFHYQVDFRARATTDARKEPCLSLVNAGLGCPASGVPGQFAVLSPLARELVIRSRHKAATLAAGVGSFNISGNPANFGEYLSPVPTIYPDLNGANLALASQAIIFEGVPWVADRRLSPGGCLDNKCESTPQPLDPFPFSGLDPRSQVPLPDATRPLAFFPFGAGNQIAFPQVDPPFQALPPPAGVGLPPPPPALAAVSPAGGAQATSEAVTITGSNFLPGATCSFGAGIIAACNVVSSTTANAVLLIDAHAAVGAHDVIVTNPDLQLATLTGGFTVAAPPQAPAPVLTSLSLVSGTQGSSSSLTLSGANFVAGARCDFGVGITASCTINSPISATAVVLIDAAAAVGARTVTLTNPDGQSAALAGGFTVTALPVVPTAVFTASPGQILKGASSTLTFNTTGATAVTIDPLGSFPPNGTVLVSPLTTTTYTLTATGPGGSTTASTTVTVTLPPG
jgi:hypothetical protein